MLGSDPIFKDYDWLVRCIKHHNNEDYHLDSLSKLVSLFKKKWTKRGKGELVLAYWRPLHNMLKRKRQNLTKS